MMAFPIQRRQGFTLFEVVIAIALSVVLITALYLTLNMHFQYARSGREIIDETVVTRSIVNRLRQDIDCQLSAIDPRLQAKQRNSATGGSSSSSGSSASSSSSTSSSSSSSSTPGNAVVFNLGVFGDSNHLVLTGRGVPRDLTQPAQSAPTLTSDLRRVTYWLVGDKGLARQEITAVTGSDVTGSVPPALPPAVGNAESYIIAPEVKKFSLEYYDGSTWQSTWDGSTLDPTTSYPKGPPLAIAFTITLEMPGRGGAKGKEVTCRHVVAIATANSAGQSQSQPQPASP